MASPCTGGAARRPAVTFSVEAMLSGAIAERLRSGQLDLAVVFGGQVEPHEDELARQLWFVDDSRLAVPADSPLLARPPMRLAELNEQDFVLFRRDLSPRMHDMIVHHFHQRGLSPRIVQEGTSHYTVLGLVAAGLGCSVMPVSAQARMPDGVRLLKVPDLALHTPIHAVWRAGAETPLLRRFVDLLTASEPD